MKPRAVLFDIYKTLLTVGPPPPDASARWRTLWRTTFGATRPVSLTECGRRCRGVIEAKHATARAAGIPNPEVNWPAVMVSALPALANVSPTRREAFIFGHMQLCHTTALDPAAPALLRHLVRARIPLGIVSNCQAYTLRELDEALRSAGLGLDRFEPDLVFLSYEHGFSKPDPHVFRMLAARLALRGIEPGETLVVGDREDNDIAPARAHGFKTWHLHSDAGGQRPAGSWRQLDEWIQSSVAPDMTSPRRTSGQRRRSGSKPGRTP